MKTQSFRSPVSTGYFAVLPAVLSIILTLPLRAQAPAAIAAEMDRLAAQSPRIVSDPAGRAILAAKASGRFKTDKQAPTSVRDRHTGIGGDLKSAVAHDGVQIPNVRSAEDQRFLEMNDLVPRFSAKAVRTRSVLEKTPYEEAIEAEKVRVYRNRYRYVARILELDISAIEQKWHAEDAAVEIRKVKAEVAAIKAGVEDARQRQTRELNELQNELNQMRSERDALRR
jgi:hypothetical protein